MFVRTRVVWENSSSIRVMLFSIPGHNCELNTDDCASSPCKNGATCTDGVFAYTCTCAAGWTGKNCDTDINECDLLVCQNDATCLNLDGTYNCTCKPGFSDVNCSTDIDECESSPCVNGNCTDLVNGFNCTCFPGYTGNRLWPLVTSCHLQWCTVEPQQPTETQIVMDYIKGVMSCSYLRFLKKAWTCLWINWIPKIMVQFCY